VSPNRSGRDPTSAAAAATRLWRERKADGMRVVPVEVFEHEIRELIRRRFLKPDDAQDRVLIGRAVARVLEALCR
jgi:hypothetical protein